MALESPTAVVNHTGEWGQDWGSFSYENKVTELLREPPSGGGETSPRGAQFLRAGWLGQPVTRNAILLVAPLGRAGHGTEWSHGVSKGPLGLLAVSQYYTHLLLLLLLPPYCAHMTLPLIESSNCSIEEQWTTSQAKVFHTVFHLRTFELEVIEIEMGTCCSYLRSPAKVLHT